MADKNATRVCTQSNHPTGISPFSKEYDFLKGLSDLENALDELVEANRYRNRSTLPPVSLKTAYDGHADSDSLKCCCSTDFTYLRLHEVRLQVTSCKSKLESLLSPAMHNGSATLLDHAGECKRYDCVRPLTSAPVSPRNEKKSVADKNKNKKSDNGDRHQSPENAHRISLACCSIPVRRRAQHKQRNKSSNSQLSNAPLDAAPPKLTPAVSALLCLGTYDNVIRNFLKVSNEELPEKMARGLKSIKFDNFMWTDHQLMLMIKCMFRDLQLVEQFGVDVDIFDSWLCAVYRHYNPVPYHNFSHAFMVVQMIYALICQLKLTRYLTKLEQFTLLASALVHDIDHPGLNNAYHINARTSLALLYNDLSPLENHHCATAFRILGLPQCNILSKFSREEYKEIRSTLVNCVLATDMAKHFEICRNIEKDMFDAENKVCLLDWNKKEHHLNIDMLLIKWADISNEIRPLEVATKWTDCLLNEFFRQGDLEKELGLPVSPLMDRQNVTRISAQVNFITFVLNPLAELMVHIFPPLDNDITVCLRSKVTYYKSLENFEQESDQPEANPATQK